MRKLSMIALAAVAFLGITSSANAATALLQTNDFVGISFWLVSMGMIAATVFLCRKKYSCSILENICNSSWIGNWCSIRSLHVHERSMGNNRRNSTVYRYIDWLITVPLQMIEFYLILAAVRKVPTSIFWKLLIVLL